MITVRNGIFETNSSSTHAIAVIKDKDIELDDIYDSWEDYYFEFGRETYRLLETWDYKLAYVYIVLLTIKDSSRVVKPQIDLENFKSRVCKLFDDVREKQESKHNNINVTPEHIFKVLDLNSLKQLGKVPDNESIELPMRAEMLFEHVLRDKYNSYVDHTEYFEFCIGDDRRIDYPCVEFLEKLLNDDDYLRVFLFSRESYITIGGDEYRGYNLKTVGFEYDYGREEDWIKRIEEYKETHDVYFKGN